MGVIHQKPHLFNQTLRDNLLIGRLDATDEELKEVLSKVGLGDLLDRLPLGLDTMVDESGRRFSGENVTGSRLRASCSLVFPSSSSTSRSAGLTLRRNRVFSID